MTNLINQLKARLENPELNHAFNKRVQPIKSITKEKKEAYQEAHEAFQLCQLPTT